MNISDDDALPGLLKIKSALATLAANIGRSGLGGKQKYVEKLYPEIRAARTAGHSFVAISDAIRKADPEAPRFSASYLSALFRDLDAAWERRTGVPALPVGKPRGRRKGKGWKAA